MRKRRERRRDLLEDLLAARGRGLPRGVLRDPRQRGFRRRVARDDGRHVNRRRGRRVRHRDLQAPVLVAGRAGVQHDGAVCGYTSLCYAKAIVEAAAKAASVLSRIAGVSGGGGAAAKMGVASLGWGEVEALRRVAARVLAPSRYPCMPGARPLDRR